MNNQKELEEYVKGNWLIFLWSGFDSKVFRVRNTNTVIKLYPELSESEIQEYHDIHHYASQKVREEYSAWIRLSGNFRWQGSRGLVQYMELRVLDLIHVPIIEVSKKNFPKEIHNQKWDKLINTPIPNKAIATVIPYVGWEELYRYMDLPQWEELLSIVSWELESLKIPIIGTPEFPLWLHPINIKVFPPHEGKISLVVTDIGAAIRSTLAVNAVLNL